MQIYIAQKLQQLSNSIMIWGIKLKWELFRVVKNSLNTVLIQTNSVYSIKTLVRYLNWVCGNSNLPDVLPTEISNILKL